MRNLLILALVALIQPMAMASDNAKITDETSKLEFTRFYYVNPRDTDLYLAELCGQVAMPFHQNARVNIVTDEGFRSESRYSALPDQDGKFCVIVRTHSGEATGSLWTPGLGNRQQTSMKVDPR